MWHDVEKICEQSGSWQGTGNPWGSRTTCRDEGDVLCEQPLKCGRSHSVWITTVEEWSRIQPHMGGAPGSYGVCRNSGTGCSKTEGGNSQRCISQHLMLHHVLHCILPKTKLGKCWVILSDEVCTEAAMYVTWHLEVCWNDRHCLAVICAPLSDIVLSQHLQWLGLVTFCICFTLMVPIPVGNVCHTPISRRCELY